MCITRARAAQSRSVLSMEISWAPAMYVTGPARACSLGLVAAAPIVRVRVPQLARTGVRARLQPAEVVARRLAGCARASGWL